MEKKDIYGENSPVEIRSFTMDPWGPGKQNLCIGVWWKNIAYKHLE